MKVQMMKELSLDVIAPMIVRPRATTIQGIYTAARKTLDLKLTNGWQGSCVCGFNEGGELTALWCGDAIEDRLVNAFPNYGFSIGHIGNICAFLAWAGRWQQSMAADIRDGVLVPVHEDGPKKYKIKPKH